MRYKSNTARSTKTIHLLPVVSLLVHKMGGGEWGTYSRRALILNFGRQEGRLFGGGAKSGGRGAGVGR